MAVTSLVILRPRRWQAAGLGGARRARGRAGRSGTVRPRRHAGSRRPLQRRPRQSGSDAVAAAAPRPAAGRGHPDGVVSNQSGIARGLIRRGQVEAVNRPDRGGARAARPWAPCAPTAPPTGAVPQTAARHGAGGAAVLLGVEPCDVGRGRGHRCRHDGGSGGRRSRDPGPDPAYRGGRAVGVRVAADPAGTPCGSSPAAAAGTAVAGPVKASRHASRCGWAAPATSADRTGGGAVPRPAAG